MYSSVDDEQKQVAWHSIGSRDRPSKPLGLDLGGIPSVRQAGKIDLLRFKSASGDLHPS